MYDSYPPFQECIKEPFNVRANRYEIWEKEGEMTRSGKTAVNIEAKVKPIVEQGYNIRGEWTTMKKEVYEVSLSPAIYADSNDREILKDFASAFIFDSYMTLNDRFLLVTLPMNTNTPCENIESLRAVGIIPTREKKDFQANEPFCCGIFTRNGGDIAKIQFKFCHPKKLIELYINEPPSIF